MVVFGTKQKVGQQDGHSGRGDDHQNVAQEQEAKHVVNLVKPQGVVDVVNFNEDGAEGQDACKQDGRSKLQRLGLPRNLTRNLVGADRVRKGVLLEAKETSQSRKRNGDDKPDGNKSKHGSKGNSAGGVCKNQKEVEENEGAKDNTRNQDRSQDGIELESLAAKSLVESSRDVAAKESKESVKHNHDRGQRATVGGRKETQQGKDQSSTSHKEQLSSRANKDGEKHAVLGRAEHIAMNKLPATVLLNLFSQINVIVSCNVLAESTKKNCSDHAGQKHNGDD